MLNGVSLVWEVPEILGWKVEDKTWIKTYLFLWWIENIILKFSSFQKVVDKKTNILLVLTGFLTICEWSTIRSDQI